MSKRRYQVKLKPADHSLQPTEEMDLNELATQLELVGLELRDYYEFTRLWREFNSSYDITASPRRHDAFIMMDNLPKFLKQSVKFFNASVDLDLELVREMAIPVMQIGNVKKIHRIDVTIAMIKLTNEYQAMESSRQTRLIEKIENLMAKRFPTRKAMDGYIFSTTAEEFLIQNRRRVKRPSMRMRFNEMMENGRSFFKRTKSAEKKNNLQSSWNCAQTILPETYKVVNKKLFYEHTTGTQYSINIQNVN